MYRIVEKSIILCVFYAVNLYLKSVICSESPRFFDIYLVVKTKNNYKHTSLHSTSCNTSAFKIMDEVLEKFGKNLRTEDEPSATNFEGLYKNWGKFNNQEQRRKDILSVQRVKRNDLLDTFRGVVELVEAVEGSNIFQIEKPMYKPQIYVAGFTRTAYSNVLMLSEWMVEKPEDFHDKWLVVPCPMGIRTLVVASKGTTKCFSKYGHFKFECSTALPGGSRNESGHDKRCCVLDCFYVDNMKTMFVLDLLAWNNLQMADGEAEFRYFWLQSQMLELPEVKKLSKRNHIIFKVLTKVSCARESFDEFMMTIPHFKNFSPKLDGLLFYHKRAHYFAGHTPLVGWLYPYMVPEVIGPEVKVNPAYLAEKPKDYVCQADFITKFEERAATVGKRKAKKSSCVSMDTTPLPSLNTTSCPSPPPIADMSRQSKTDTMPMEADVPKDTTEKETEEKSEKME